MEVLAPINLDIVTSILGQIKRMAYVKRARLVCRLWREAGARVLVARGTFLDLSRCNLTQLHHLQWLRNIAIPFPSQLTCLGEWPLRRLSIEYDSKLHFALSDRVVKKKVETLIIILHLYVPKDQMLLSDFGATDLTIFDRDALSQNLACLFPGPKLFAHAHHVMGPDTPAAFQRYKSVMRSVLPLGLETLSIPYYLGEEEMAGEPPNSDPLLWRSLRRLTCTGFTPRALPYLRSLQELSLNTDLAGNLEWLGELPALRAFAWRGKTAPNAICVRHPTLQSVSLDKIYYSSHQVSILCPELLRLELDFEESSVSVSLATPVLQSYWSYGCDLPEKFPSTLRTLHLRCVSTTAILDLRGTVVRTCIFEDVILGGIECPPLFRLRLSSSAIGILPQATTIRIEGSTVLAEPSASVLHCARLKIKRYSSLVHLSSDPVRYIRILTHNISWGGEPQAYPLGLESLRTTMHPSNLEELVAAGLRELILYDRSYVPPVAGASSIHGTLKISYRDLK